MTTSPKTKTPASSPHRPSHRRTLRRKRSLPFGGQPGQHSPDNEPESVSESKALENPERALEDPERALEDPERLREPQESLGRLEESRPPGEVCCLSPSGEHHPGLRGAGPTRRRAYAADLEDFRHGCKKYDREWLPARPKTIGLYLGARGDELSLATLERRRAAIASLHKIASLGYFRPSTKKRATSRRPPSPKVH